MARRPYPRMSGANPPIRTPKPAPDTSMHLREIRFEGHEVWTACDQETTENGLKTTYATKDVTCERCRAIVERRRRAMGFIG